jgi:hypothetical protein
MARVKGRDASRLPQWPVVRGGGRVTTAEPLRRQIKWRTRVSTAVRVTVYSSYLLNACSILPVGLNFWARFIRFISTGLCYGHVSVCTHDYVITCH